MLRQKCLVSHYLFSQVRKQIADLDALEDY